MKGVLKFIFGKCPCFGRDEISKTTCREIHCICKINKHFNWDFYRSVDNWRYFEPNLQQQNKH